MGEGEKKNEEVYGKEAAAFTDRTRWVERPVLFHGGWYPDDPGAEELSTFSRLGENSCEEENRAWKIGAKITAGL